MRVLVYGAGAIGGYLGAMLAHGGQDVTLLARGATLEALARDGLQVSWADGRQLHVQVPTCAPGQAPGRFDLVIVTLKSMQLPEAARDIAATVAADGAVLMVQNGLPWWYFDRVASPWAGTRLSSLDPDGELAATLDLDRVVGAVIFKPVMATAAGRLFVPATKGGKLLVGEVDDRPSERLQRIAGAVSHEGLPVVVAPDIRAAKWDKLMINLVWNPLCALTQSASGHIAATAGGAQLARAMMAEGLAVATSLGIRTAFDAELELGRVQGNFTQQPSMLQDVRAGRPLEWQAILGSVIEVAALTGVPVPTLKTIAACVGVLDARIRTDGLAFLAAPRASLSPGSSG
jgi:2-dehydropantoate 2-reductase